MRNEIEVLSKNEAKVCSPPVSKKFVGMGRHTVPSERTVRADRFPFERKAFETTLLSGKNN